MLYGVLKKFILLSAIVCVSLATAAQRDSIPISKILVKPSLQVLANAGIVSGKSGRDLQVQAIPGVQYSGWFAGIGGGLDYYFWRTVPLFVDVRKTFSNPHVFLYGDAGWDLPWIKKSSNFFGYQQKFKAGLYYDVGAGWNFKIHKTNSLLLSAGYTEKKVNEIRLSNFDKTKLLYELRRISIKVGFQF
jgi:hypothetical protein